MSDISLKVATWQEWQDGKTKRIKLNPPEFTDYPKKQLDARQERDWWNDKVRNGKIIIYTIMHASLGMIGYIKAYNINKAKLRCDIEVEILDCANYNKGYAFIAGQDFLHILTNQYHIHHYRAMIHPDDERGVKLFTKLEFKDDGKMVDPDEEEIVHLKYIKSI